MERVEIRTIRQDAEEAERLSRFEMDRHRPSNTGVPTTPPILRIEVTNRCNANCIFCAYQYQERPFTSMSFEVFQLAVDQYTALGGSAINFSPVVGEALIDRNLEEKVAYVRKHPQYRKLELFTNGILLTKERFESIVSAGINQIHLALSGFSANEYQSVYRNNRYPRLLQNLRDIATSPKLKDVDMVVHSRTSSLWATQAPDYLEIKALNAYRIVFEPGVVSWHGAIEQKDLPGHMFLVRAPRDQSKPCLVLWGGLTIMADGEMTLCGCCDVNGTGLPLGNIKDVRLDTHLKNGHWLKIRDSFYEGQPPAFCQGCDAYYPHG